jgi:adenylate cyclase
VRANARFCDGCGARISPDDAHAEFKQVTVLFADVVRSMDLASAVGPERLREIMTELFTRSSAVVTRFGGTTDKFTGDGLMAVFGAPAALEDHALRACLAGLDIQREARLIAADVSRRDHGMSLQVRIGLNSGRVIAGDIGYGPMSYTAIGEQVGLAQRMESVAPPGGVMLSDATARLVDDTAVLSEPESVMIKGSTSPVTAYRLLGIARRNGPRTRHVSTLVGREWELNTIGALLDQSISGKGRIVGLVGPPGIGKSRMVDEIGSIAVSRSARVFTSRCESHKSGIPFHTVAGLLRDVLAIDGLGDEDARKNVRARLEFADPEDVALVEDLLGIHEGDASLSAIDPDARGRRLTSLLNAAAVARTTPVIYVIEDVHWIDEVSETMLVQFAAVVPQTCSMLLVTFRPEYRGALDNLPRSHRIALAPLDDSQSMVLVAELLGSDQSIGGLMAQIAERAAGNPFFAEELVRDLAERRVLVGRLGGFVRRGDTVDVRVPASLQATIAARIDRLGPTAKRTLNAAAVIGSQFDADSLACVVDAIDVAELATAELVDQVTFAANAEYAFRHPLIRAVAYESQLTSDRAELHRRLAAAIEVRDPDLVDSNSTLIAQHLEAAGDLDAAFDWHMRAATWARFRDVRTARTSWQRARDVADHLDADDENRTAKRIAPRLALCVSAFRFSASVEELGFEELRDLCTSVGDSMSLAFGMAGVSTALIFHSRYRDAASVALELSSLLDAIGDQPLTISLCTAASNALVQAGKMTEGLRLAQRAIGLADGDPRSDNTIVVAPLAIAYGLSGFSRFALGMPGWCDDFDRAATIARPFDLTSHLGGILFRYVAADAGGCVVDATRLTETAAALEAAERSVDDFSFDVTRLARGLALVHSDKADYSAGLALLNEYRDACIGHGYATNAVRWVDVQNAKQQAATGNLDGGIETARVAVDFLYESGDMTSRGPAVTALVELLISRGAESDVVTAKAAIERLAAVPTDPGFVLHELPLLRMRALVAQESGEEAAYRDYRDRYRSMATELGFDGHIAIAEAMI